MNKEYHFFWKSILSNWTKSKFTIYNIWFNCGEQYMMWSKAILFNDKEIADKILASNNPKEIKNLGRQVKNFDSKIWDEIKYKQVKLGLFARFKQDEKARKELLKHKGKIFVEASPYDRIWGIGYSEDNAINNIDKWGENLLGKILTEISNELE